MRSVFPTIIRGNVLLIVILYEINKICIRKKKKMKIKKKKNIAILMYLQNNKNYLLIMLDGSRRPLRLISPFIIFTLIWSGCNIYVT